MSKGRQGGRVSTSVTADQAQEIRDAVAEKWGFVPNLVEQLVVSPETARLYLEGSEIIAGGLLNEEEQNAVKLAVSAANSCGYCRSAHRALGRRAGTSTDDLQRIDGGDLPSDERLAPLVRATRLVMDKRGWLDEADLKALEAEGVDRRRLYEIISIVALKTVSNYVNHIAHTAVDPEFGG